MRRARTIRGGRGARAAGKDRRAAQGDRGRHRRGRGRGRDEAPAGEVTRDASLAGDDPRGRVVVRARASGIRARKRILCQPPFVDWPKIRFAAKGTVSMFVGRNDASRTQKRRSARPVSLRRRVSCIPRRRQLFVGRAPTINPGALDASPPGALSARARAPPHPRVGRRRPLRLLTESPPPSTRCAPRRRRRSRRGVPSRVPSRARRRTAGRATVVVPAARFPRRRAARPTSPCAPSAAARARAPPRSSRRTTAATCSRRAAAGPATARERGGAEPPRAPGAARDRPDPVRARRVERVAHRARGVQGRLHERLLRLRGAARDAGRGPDQLRRDGGRRAAHLRGGLPGLSLHRRRRRRLRQRHERQAHRAVRASGIRGRPDGGPGRAEGLRAHAQPRDPQAGRRRARPRRGDERDEGPAGIA